MRLDKAEFIELIGRIADVKFVGTAIHKSMTLVERIGIVLDHVLPICGERKVTVDTGALEDTESDADY